MKVELLIQQGNKVYEPIVEEGITWDLERKGVPGKLQFNVKKDDKISFQEGSAVRLRIDEKNVFYGFVFTKSRDKQQLISVTAYDQLRYFKNKDTYVYTNKTATELIKMIAADFRLNVGKLEDTYYKIPSRVEDNQTLFDIIQNALDETLMNRNEMFVLYDDFGKIRLDWIEQMKLGIVIDEETGENFDYQTSIDGETYNKIKLVRENEETGKRDVWIAQHGENMNQWGILQYFDTIDEKVNGKAKADALLKLYNTKKRNLKLTKVKGDIRVRAGSSLVVKLDLGDMKVQNFMVVEKVTHTFRNDEHLMDLTLRGGEFVSG